MTAIEAHQIIEQTVADCNDTACDAATIASAVVGALAVGGYVIVKVDADVVRRVLAEVAKEAPTKR